MLRWRMGVLRRRFSRSGWTRRSPGQMIGRCFHWHLKAMKRRTNVALIALVVVGLSIPLVLHSRSAMLKRLQQCYREIPTSGREYFESSCTLMRLRLLVLAGVSRAELESTLGAADWCTDAISVSGKVLVRPKCLQPGWAFFYLPPSASLGGGLNLVCWSLNGDTCLFLNWLLTA